MASAPTGGAPNTNEDGTEKTDDAPPPRPPRRRLNASSMLPLRAALAGLEKQRDHDREERRRQRRRRDEDEDHRGGSRENRIQGHASKRRRIEDFHHNDDRLRRSDRRTSNRGVEERNARDVDAYRKEEVAAGRARGWEGTIRSALERKAERYDRLVRGAVDDGMARDGRMHRDYDNGRLRMEGEGNQLKRRSEEEGEDGEVLVDFDRKREEEREKSNKRAWTRGGESSPERHRSSSGGGPTRRVLDHSDNWRRPRDRSDSQREYSNEYRAQHRRPLPPDRPRDVPIQDEFGRTMFVPENSSRYRTYLAEEARKVRLDELQRTRWKEEEEEAKEAKDHQPWTKGRDWERDGDHGKGVDESETGRAPCGNSRRPHEAASMPVSSLDGGSGNRPPGRTEGMDGDEAPFLDHCTEKMSWKNKREQRLELIRQKEKVRQRGT